MAACQATTKAGNPCRNPVTLDTGYCIAHSPKELVESRGFGGSQPRAGRPRNPRAVDILREKLEQNVDQVLDPLFGALKADRGLVVGQTTQAHVEYVPDWPARLAAVREILDRSYGKPMQSGEQPDSGVTVNIALVTDHELRLSTADIRRRLASSRSVKPSWPDAGD